MARKKITLETAVMTYDTNDASGGMMDIARVDVPGYATNTPGLAVHARHVSYDDGEPQRTTGWLITHIPSGLSLIKRSSPFRTLYGAEKAAEALGKLDVDWEKTADQLREDKKRITPLVQAVVGKFLIISRPKKERAE